MNFNMTKIAAGLALAVAATGAQAAATLTFANSAGGAFASSIYVGGTANTAFTAGNEFRMINTTNDGLGGGGQKSTMSGNEVWGFDATNQWATVAGNALVGDAASSTHCPAGGCAGIDDGAVFFGPVFGFLASTVGNGIGLTPGSIAGSTFNMGDTFSVLMPIAEAHWGSARFPMASVTFSGVVTDALGHFVLTAEHKITAAEDPDGAGFADFTAQWRYEGVASGSIAAVPEASTYGMMLAGLGLVGFAVRRRKTMA
jgi:hypothetical protein